MMMMNDYDDEEGEEEEEEEEDAGEGTACGAAARNLESKRASLPLELFVVDSGICVTHHRMKGAIRIILGVRVRSAFYVLQMAWLDCCPVLPFCSSFNLYEFPLKCCG
jgi:hypothetical protein